MGADVLFAVVVSPSRQSATTLVPVGFEYAVCLTTCVANGISFGDCIQHCLPSKALVETREETHLTNSSVFCTVGCAVLTCPRLSSQGRMPGILPWLLSLGHVKTAHPTVQNTELFVKWVSSRVSTSDFDGRKC
ncbi:hypothetical protein PVK06_000067 [Gossypium arboreum]|uniref:Secreted protein n=1 Tax=Gossypium arboreum TaxID=29729 RepID=A0ABR0QYD0_GOSAR|nr:hypothetical protein PVK06_000067 [Gossypium arboreum]